MNRRFIRLITGVSHEHFPLIDCWSVTTKDEKEREMPIQRIVTPIVNERPSPLHRRSHYRHTKTRDNLTRSSIIKWDHVPQESRPIPPTVTNDCSGISLPLRSSDLRKKNPRQMDDKFHYWVLPHQKEEENVAQRLICLFILETISSNPQQSFKCPYCTDEFLQITHLHLHTNQCHPEQTENLINCVHCNAVFTNKVSETRSNSRTSNIPSLSSRMICISTNWITMQVK